MSADRPAQWKRLKNTNKKKQKTDKPKTNISDVKKDGTLKETVKTRRKAEQHQDITLQLL